MDPVALLASAPSAADALLTAAMGVALAATCGLRAFLPLLVLNLLGLSGRVEFTDSFGFLADWPATLAFGTAAGAEWAGDKIPGFDHFMDAFGVVIRPTCATVLAASCVTSFDPLTATVLGLVAGGSAAAAVQVVKAKARVLSSAFTGGVGNVALSLGEDVAALGSVALAVVAPTVLLSAGLLCFAVGAVLVARRRQGRALAALA